MYVVRNSTEYPKGDPRGYPVFDGALMRSLILKNGQVPQALDFGNVTAVTATYTVLLSDGLVELGNTTSYTATLPAISAVPKGWGVTFKKTGASGVNTISRAGSDTIDGATSITLQSQYQAVRITSDGTNWIASGASATLLKQTIAAGASQTVSDGTDVVVITSDTAIALTLPAAVTKAGKLIYFKKNAGAGSAACTLTRAGSDTIDGGTTYTITADKRVTVLYSDGTAWFIIVPSGLALTAG